MTDFGRSLPATILTPVDHEIVIKRSRFLTHLAPIASAEQADAILAEVRKREWSARHHCSAQVTGLLGDRARSSDDGEPAGTAGMPILEVLRRRELTDVLAIVTRYFGGVKLGAGGLIRAYSSAVSESLELATLVDRKLLQQTLIDVPHADAGRVDNFIRDWATHHGAQLGEPHYAANATFELWAPSGELTSLDDDIAALSAGAVAVNRTGVERVIDVPRLV